MSRSFYGLRRTRPHGFDSEDLGTFSTEAQARAAMASWKRDNPQWTFRICLLTIEIVHEDPRPVTAAEAKGATT